MKIRLLSLAVFLLFNPAPGLLAQSPPNPGNRLLLWMDASASATLTLVASGGDQYVMAWQDRLSSKTALPVAVGLGPRFVPNALNGKPAIAFGDPGTSVPLKLDAVVNGTVGTYQIFVVSSGPAGLLSTSTWQRLLSSGTGAAAPDWQIPRPDPGPGGVPAPYFPRLSEKVGPALAVKDLVIGSAGNPPNYGNQFSGHIHEILVYSGTLVDSQRKLVADYITAKWSDPGVAQTVGRGELKQAALAHGLRIGVATRDDFYSGAHRTNPGADDLAYQSAVGETYNQITPENQMKWKKTEAAREDFSFGAANDHVAFALEHGMKVHGHTFVWYNGNPGWLTNRTWSDGELVSNTTQPSVLRTHLATFATGTNPATGVPSSPAPGYSGTFAPAAVGYNALTPGTILHYDVVNEAFNGPPDSTTLRTGLVWYATSGSSYIEKAFAAAREIMPAAKLVYNDFSTDGYDPNGGPAQKSDAVYQMAVDLHQKGLLDAVGIQRHIDNTATDADLANFATNVARLTSQGIEVYVSEMDVPIPIPVSEAARVRQGEIYAQTVKVLLGQPLCPALTFWGNGDSNAYANRNLHGKFLVDEAVPLDRNYQPKTAFAAMVAEAQNSASYARIPYLASGRDNAGQANWYRGKVGNGSNLNIMGHRMILYSGTGTPSQTSNTQLWTYFDDAGGNPPAALASGETLSLNCDIQLEASMPSVPDAIRIGLVDSNGTRRTADAENPPERRDDPGYGLTIGVGGSKYTRYVVEPSAQVAPPFQQVSTTTTLGAIPNSFGLDDTLVHHLRFDITRNGGALVIRAYLDGVLYDGGRTVAAPETCQFDSVSIDGVRAGTRILIGNLNVARLPAGAPPPYGY